MSGDGLVFAKAHPRYDRIDLVYEDHDRRYRIATGAPADRPESPHLPDDGATVVAHVRIRAGSTGIASLDLRKHVVPPIGGIVVDQERLQRDIARGLVTTVPGSQWQTTSKPLSIDDLRAAMALIDRRYERDPVPAMVECHTTALAAFRAGIPPVERIPWSSVVAHPLGIPIVVDPTLPARTWRVLDDDGNVLHEGTAAA